MKLSLRGLVVLVCVLLLLCAGLWQAQKRGGIVNALHLPPVLDSSTPAAQSGFVLLGAQRPEDGISNFHLPHGPETLSATGEEDCAAGVWVQVPPGVTVQNCRMTARASSGEAFPLKPVHVVSANDEILFASLPGGFPGSLDWMDVTVSDSAAHTARWRVTRLQVMRHAIAPPVAVQDTFQQDGLRLNLRAFRERSEGKGGQSVQVGREYIHYQLFPTVTPGTHRWAYTFTEHPFADWQPYPQAQPNGYGFMDFDSTDARDLMRTWHGAVLDNFIINPFVRSDHYVRMKGRVQQFETYDERVTFHNVSVKRDDGTPVFTVTQAQTVTTPSGVVVTLPAQNRATFMQGGTLVEPGLLLNVSPSVTQNSLPASPLVKNYGRPVSISLDVPKPMGIVGWSVRPDGHNKYDVYVPAGQATQFKNFAVIVRQRAVLHSFPLQLTAPIADAPPQTL